MYVCTRVYMYCVAGDARQTNLLSVNTLHKCTWQTRSLKMLTENIYRFLCSPASDMKKKNNQNKPKHQNNKNPETFQARGITFLYVST